MQSAQASVQVCDFTNWQNLSGTQDQINLNTPTVSISLGTSTALFVFFPLVFLYQLWTVFSKMSPATQTIQHRPHPHTDVFSLSHRIESLDSAKNSTAFLLRLLQECWAKMRAGQSSDSLCRIWSSQRNTILFQTKRLSLKNTFWICLKCFHYFVPPIYISGGFSSSSQSSHPH